jgi:hypothetical protein
MRFLAVAMTPGPSSLADRLYEGDEYLETMLIVFKFRVQRDKEPRQVDLPM